MINVNNFANKPIDLTENNFNRLYNDINQLMTALLRNCQPINDRPLKEF